MISIAFRVLTKLLEQGRKLDKYTLAKEAHCHQRTAQRVLCNEWMEERIHISGWIRSRGGPIPIYAKGPGKDAKRPDPILDAERRRNARKNAAVREREAFARRLKRLRDTVERDPITLTASRVLKTHPLQVMTEVLRGSRHGRS